MKVIYNRRIDVDGKNVEVLDFNKNHYDYKIHNNVIVNEISSAYDYCFSSENEIDKRIIEHLSFNK